VWSHDKSGRARIPISRRNSSSRPERNGLSRNSLPSICTRCKRARDAAAITSPEAVLGTLEEGFGRTISSNLMSGVRWIKRTDPERNETLPALKRYLVRFPDGNPVTLDRPPLMLIPFDLALSRIIS
jgi:hypothetical protein